MNRGILYIVFNRENSKDHLSECFYSAKSVKKKCLNIPITLITDHIIKNEHIDNVILRQMDGKRNKQKYIYDSPYDQTIYLDSDTEICYNILEIYEILGKFDIAIAHDFSRKSNKWSKAIEEYEKIPYSFPEYNSGVILFSKSDKMKSFFDLWENLYNNYNKNFGVIADQPSFRIALWNSDLRIHTLPVEYNVRNKICRDKWDKRVKNGEENEYFMKSMILHSHGLNKKNVKIEMYNF